MRFADAIFRQGHLSEPALVEALMTGERPVHLDTCSLCADRAAELGRWLDEIRVLGQESADQVFTPERLAAQHAQILRKIEQADEPPRVITFPAPAVREAREPGTRRVAPAWVGVAAAAGLVLGVIGGQVSARMSIQPDATTVQQTAPRQTETPVTSPLDPALSEVAGGPAAIPVNAPAFDEDLLLNGPGVLDFLDEMTPHITANLRTSGG